MVGIVTAIGFVALVMMLARPGGRGPQLIDGIANAWQRAAAATIQPRVRRNRGPFYNPRRPRNL